MNGRGIGRLALPAVATLLAACGAGPTPGFLMAGSPAYPPPQMNHRIATPHVELHWRCAKDAGGALQLDGVARNPTQSQPVRYLEFELLGLDREERVVSSARGAAQNFILRTNEVTPFRLYLRPTGAESRFDLRYQYIFDEVEMDARLASAIPMGTRIARNQGSIIRDACNERMHEAR
jgi:hypothetical protein